MADLNQPSDIKAYFKDTIVANHTELSHFFSGGDEKPLVEGFKNQVKEGEYALFLEWPQKQYRDNDGSIVAMLRPNLLIIAAGNKNNYEQLDTMLDKCYEILDDILIRMRSELFYRSNKFSINDLGIIDPVYFYSISNAVGIRCTLPLGDWVSLTKNTDKWSDL